MFKAQSVAFHVQLTNSIMFLFIKMFAVKLKRQVYDLSFGLHFEAAVHENAWSDISNVCLCASLNPKEELRRVR